MTWTSSSSLSTDASPQLSDLPAAAGARGAGAPGVRHAGLLEVGRVGRPHGLHGQVTVTFVSNRAERTTPGAWLHTDQGPLEITSARAHGRRHLVWFAGVDNREQAERLRGLILRAEPLSDPDELWVHELVGATVVDQHGTARGAVVGVVANPASDLLELEGGALVPARFVTSWEPCSRVHVSVPDGLFGTD